MKRVLVLVSFAIVFAAVACFRHPGETQVNTVKELAPGVYFHEGDLRGNGHCNNGWVIFDDYVLVLDANFPSGAMEIIPKIRAQTSKPIRFAFDTHHHGDHAYANQVWVEHGATPVGHEGVVEEMRRYEPQRWNDAAKTREDVRNSKLKPPTLLYRDLMVFDDGKHRVELRWFGIAHTRGDGFAWLPREKILFTGDACVNGPYNYMGDGDSGEWIKTLGRAQRLGAMTIGPGHGPSADGTLLEQQKRFFMALRDEVSRIKRKSPEEAQKEVSTIREALMPGHGKYIDASANAIIQFESQVGQVYKEMTGKQFPQRTAMREARLAHAFFHGISD